MRADQDVELGLGDEAFRGLQIERAGLDGEIGRQQRDGRCVGAIEAGGDERLRGNLDRKHHAGERDKRRGQADIVARDTVDALDLLGAIDGVVVDLDRLGAVHCVAQQAQLGEPFIKALRISIEVLNGEGGRGAVGQNERGGDQAAAVNLDLLDKTLNNCHNMLLA